jgi:toxin ParE1/3/4
VNNLSYSPDAVNDLEEIWTYISGELQNPDAARRVIDSIFTLVEKLQDFSEMGSPLSAIIGMDSDYRFLVCGNYLAFYRVMNTEVRIVRILYNRRDYIRVLFGARPASERKE